MLPLMLHQQASIFDRLQLLILADGDKLHLRSDDPSARIVHLADILTALGTTRLAGLMKTEVCQLRIGSSLLPIFRTETTQYLGIISILDPCRTNWVQPLTQVDLDRRVRKRA